MVFEDRRRTVHCRFKSGPDHKADHLVMSRVYSAEVVDTLERQGRPEKCKGARLWLVRVGSIPTSGPNVSNAGIRKD